MPRISVVVPMYNVEEYLRDCLDSLAQQTVRDLEVIMVDDGSPDSSAEIAAAYADRDARFRLVRQPNGGLGNARNTGARTATGDFLMFVDSDDILPRHALETMLTSLDSTGSDFATGNVHRLTSAGTWQSPMFARPFRTTRRATHVRKFPLLLSDRIACNKLWRRTFWDENGFRFPEGVLHEDIELVLRAHIVARSVDVIHTPVYLWRIRDGEEQSITQRRTDPRAIRDRFAAVDAVSRLLAERGERALKKQYDESVAAQDFRYTLQRLDEADAEFHALFLDLVNEFFDRAHPGVFDGMRAVERLKYHLVRRRLMPELLEVLRFEKTGGVARARVVRRLHRHYGDYPYRTDPRLKIPRHVYQLDRELSLQGRVDDVWWDGDTLHVEGHAYIRFCDLAEKGSSRIRVVLEQQGGAHEVSVPVERVYRPDVTADAKDTHYCYDWSGFRGSVPLDALKVGGCWRDATWRLRVRVRSSGVTRERVVAETAPGRAQRPEHRTRPGVLVVPTNADGSFAVRVDTMPARVESYQVDGDVLQLDGTWRGRRTDPAAARIVVGRQGGDTELTYPVAVSPGDRGPATFTTRIPLADLLGGLDVGDRASHAEHAGDGVVWDVSLRPARGARTVRLTAPEGLADERHELRGREILLHSDRRGHLSLVDRDFRPEVRSARWTDDLRIELAGVYREPTGQPSELLLSAQGRQERYVFPMHRDGDLFAATLSPTAVTTLSGTLPLTEGVWELLVRPAGQPDTGARVKVDRALFATLPLRRSLGTKELVLRDADHDALHLQVSSDLDVSERGPYRQRRLQQVGYPAFVRQGLRDAVLFEGYGGRQFADSPRAIYEELARRDTGLELLWAVDDGQTELPDGLTPVRRWGREWYEANARSRYVVTCTYRPMQRWLKKPEGQVVVQTWHGHPFKKIGFDSDRISRVAAPDYHERLALETGSWDYLVSPSPVATPILRSAFRFGGEMLETGYPRADVFFRPDRDALARRVRERLGIPAGKKVVLYAPTFRDDQEYSRNRFRLDLRLDLEHARAALGDDHVLLVRRHQKIVDTVTAADESFVRDVSLYPDVNELLVATDMLVTDYSSLMFDFATTGRPIVLFTYDLEHYRDALRGFYFDVDRLPGPCLRTSEEVVEALADAESVRRDHAPVYEAFQRDFCAFDDGKASARVVDAVFRVDGPGSA